MDDQPAAYDDDTSRRTRELLDGIRGATGLPCADCRQTLCGHDAVLSWVLGYRNAPRCGRCLAIALGESPQQLGERALQWIRRRECFVRGWLWASAVEGWPGVDRPPCTFVDDAGGPVAGAAGLPAAGAAAGVPATRLDDGLEADADWDAGALSCGDLVLELRNRLRGMEPGAVLALVAQDPAAPVDLPAWCGLTGHTLLAAQHPRYWILRRDTD